MLKTVSNVLVASSLLLNMYGFIRSAIYTVNFPFEETVLGRNNNGNLV
jgi:hypothetical protein